MSAEDARRVLASPAVLAVFAFLTVPLVLGTLDTALMTPLALPGYLILTIGSAVGNHLLPALALWTFWVPFLLACYTLAVLVGGAYRALSRGRR